MQKLPQLLAVFEGRGVITARSAGSVRRMEVRELPEAGPEVSDAPKCENCH